MTVIFKYCNEIVEWIVILLFKYYSNNVGIEFLLILVDICKIYKLYMFWGI